MTNTITPGKIRQNNQKLIYHYIYEEKKVSQQDLCINLRLSRPTVMTNLNELEAGGLIEKCGQIDSEAAGRKAVGYRIVARYKVAIGVEIVKDEVKMMALDLYGARIDRRAVPLDFENTEQYFRSVSAEILSFVNDLQLSQDQILGISFAMQALISPDGERIIYGKILDCTGLSIEAFRSYLPYDCRFIHDADSAAYAELWSNPKLSNAIFLSISRHTGGALIHEGRIVSGLHGHSATFEHIPIRRPDDARAKRCYCGKMGCVDTLCSLDGLLTEGEDADMFFAALRQGQSEQTQRWSQFLADFGEVLNMLHLVYDTDLVIGGYLAPYLTAPDLERLYEVIAERTPFEETQDFLHISSMPKHSITIGGALLYIRTFLDQWML